MYIIFDGRPYAVQNGEVHEVKFGDNGTISIGDVITNIELEGKTLYSYDEIVRKFNLKYLWQLKNDPTHKKIMELQSKIDELEEENKKLKELLGNSKKPKKEEPKPEENKEEQINEQKEEK